MESTEQPRLSGKYVWACRVCRDPNYTREGPATLYMDERYCPTCMTRQPIISFHIEHVPLAGEAA